MAIDSTAMVLAAMSGTVEQIREATGLGFTTVWRCMFILRGEYHISGWEQREGRRVLWKPIYMRGEGKNAPKPKNVKPPKVIKPPREKKPKRLTATEKLLQDTSRHIHIMSDDEVYFIRPSVKKPRHDDLFMHFFGMTPCAS